MTIINCTPHALTFMNADNEVIRILEPSGIIPRVSTTSKVVGNLLGIPEEITEFGEVENLPEPEEDTVYIVSTLVAQACPGRQDLRTPGQQVRDDKGRVIGCKSLTRPNSDDAVITKLWEVKNSLPTAMDMETAYTASDIFAKTQEAILGRTLVQLMW